MKTPVAAKALALHVLLLFFSAGIGFSQPAQGVTALLDQAKASVAFGDNYWAIEILLKAILLNPAYAPAYVQMAQCYYALGEYERAVFYIKEAGNYGPRDSVLSNLEGFCAISLGKPDDAKKLFEEILRVLPNDRDARFGMALLDLRAGRPASARATLSASLRTYPTDARALVALALITKAEGKSAESAGFLKEALRWASDDPRVCYAAALASVEAGNTIEASRLLLRALEKQPSHSAARGLLAALYYERGAYDEAVAILDKSLQYNGKDYQAWFLLALVQSAAGRNEDAELAFATLAEMRPDDEIARIALENFVMDSMALENPARSEYASWRWNRAAEFERRLMYEKALVEYRRGLSLDSYANLGRRKYANLLKLSKLPSTYLDELRFLKELGKTDQGLEDALEIYGDLLEGSVTRDWNLNPGLSRERPYTLAVYSSGPGGTPWHVASDLVIARFVRDLFASSPQIMPDSKVPRVPTFIDAFRPARESGADFFLLLTTRETEREIQIIAELRIARTGALALRIDTVRSGNDRVQLACIQIVDQISSLLPLQGRLLQRKADTALVSMGLSLGLKAGDVFLVLKNGSLSLKSDSLGLSWNDKDIVGKLTLTRLDDDAAEGKLERVGFFDSINTLDILIREPPKDTTVQKAATLPVSIASWPALFDDIRRLF